MGLDEHQQNILAFALDTERASGPRLKALAVTEDIPEVYGEFQIPTESMFSLSAVDDEPTFLSGPGLLGGAEWGQMPKELLLPTESMHMLRTIPGLLDANGNLLSEPEMFSAFERFNQSAPSPFASNHEFSEMVRWLVDSELQTVGMTPPSTFTPVHPQATATPNAREPEGCALEPVLSLERESQVFPQLSSDEPTAKPSIAELRARLARQREGRKFGAADLSQETPLPQEPIASTTRGSKRWFVVGAISGAIVIGTLGFLLGAMW